MAETRYVLVTPARNEESYLAETIESVLAQSVRPARWIVVSDGSTDRTEDIAASYCRKHDFMELVTAQAAATRNFGSKVNAFNAGYARLEGLEYEFVGNLDADVTLPPNYFQSILDEFRKDTRLGLAGGVIVEIEKGVPVPFVYSPWSVAGAIQLFRRECFEKIGGYEPVVTGGIDAIAEVKVRMRGWEVRCFPAYEVLHHKHTGTKEGGILGARFRQGIMGHSHGNHFLFEIAKAAFRLKERPYVIGSLTRLLGFAWASLKRNPCLVSAEVRRYLRWEQLNRLHLSWLTPRSESIE
jgi:GT2 family glycosyltransferase